MLRGFEDFEIKEAVARAKSVSATLHLLGRARVGSNYKVVREAIVRMGLSTNHWKASLAPVPARPLEECLVSRSTYPRGRLKERLIKGGLLENKCQECGIPPQWNNKVLVLRLDHINGIRDDNRLENLRLVCPNCDSQSATFCGRNIISARGLSRGKCGCGARISYSAKHCKPCSMSLLAKTPLSQKSRRKKIEWPTLEALNELVSEKGFAAAGRVLGVSDNAIRKHLKMYGAPGGN